MMIEVGSVVRVEYPRSSFFHRVGVVIEVILKSNNYDMARIEFTDRGRIEWVGLYVWKLKVITGPRPRVVNPIFLGPPCLQ